MGEQLGPDSSEVVDPTHQEIAGDDVVEFARAVKALPTETQKQAEPYLALHRRISDSNINLYSEVLTALSEYVKNLPREQQDELRKTAIFRFFIGSTSDLNEWRGIDLLSQDGKFEHFLDTTVAEIIKRNEEAERQP